MLPALHGVGVGREGLVLPEAPLITLSGLREEEGEIGTNDEKPSKG